MGRLADIAEFAQRISAQFAHSQEGIPAANKLGLSPKTVEELIKSVFYASVIMDEGRFPTVTLMTYRKNSQQEEHFPFTDPVSPNPTEIAKLSQAVGESNHLKLVCDKGEVFLGGIQVTMLDQLRHYGFSSYRPANPLRLVIVGPGHIEVSTGSTALIFKGGEISEETPFLAADTTKALAQSVANELAGKTTATIESIEDIFNELVRGIVRLGHGGLLLVTKAPDMNEFSSHREIDSPLLQDLLIRYWTSAAALVSASGGVSPAFGKGKQRDKDPEFLKVASATTMLENCVSSIAHLAGMDGAIVMDHSCKVVAFNAIISKKPGTGREAKLVDSIGREVDESEVIASRGSRHQAAFSYAKRVANSFAFVISQDGRISAFHNQGDGTFLHEKDLRVVG